MKAAVAAPKVSPARRSATTSGLLQRQCACGSRGAGTSGECEACGKKRTAGLQAKMRVSVPGDAFELEADQVADRVMSMSPPGGGQDMEARAAEPLVQRRVADAPAELSEGTSIVDEVLRSPGQPLDAATRAYFEPRFGHDFSRVRVHADAGAAESARTVNASAYTVGEHIVFESSQFDPGSHSGRKLLAHELAHTIQQRGGHAPTQQPHGMTPLQTARSAVTHGARPYLARQPKTEAAREELEVVEGEKSTDPSDQPWFVFHDAAAKGDKKALLPAGARVEARGPPITDVRQGADGKKQRIVFRQVRVLSIPNGSKDPSIGKQGTIQSKFLAPVRAPAPAPAKAQPAAPTQAEPAKDEPQTEKPGGTIRARLDGLPAQKKWNGKLGRTWMAVNLCVTAMDFWFNEPTDRDTATRIISQVNKNYKDKYLTDSVFDKKFHGMSGFATTALRMFYLAGKSALERLRQLTIPGIGMGDAIWESEIHRLKRAADEVLSVMADDIAVKDAPNIKQLDDMTSLKGSKAFMSGLLAGARAELSDEDYKQLTSKLSDSTLLSAVAPPIIVAGAAVGIGKDIVDALKSLYEFVTSPVEMIKDMLTLLTTLMTDEEGSRALGEAIGAQEAKQLRAMSKEDIVTFTYKLGEKVGPMVVYTVLSIVTGGAAGGAAYSARLAAFLEKFPKVAKQINRIKALLPEKKAKVDIDASDVRKPPSAPDKPDAKSASGQSTPAGESGPKARKAGTKRFPDAEAKGLKLLAKDPKNLRKVTDKKLLSEGYELEIPSGEHTYRRRGDGTWCRFSTKDCDFLLDSDDDAAFLRAAAKREQAIAAGWAIEDYVAGLGYQRPKASNFPGIDGWKGGKPRGRGVIADADVIQVKGINDLGHGNVIRHYNEATEKLLPDSNSWEEGGLKIINPKSRTLHVLFDQDTYSRLGFSQQEELNKVLKTMASVTHKPPISVRFFYFSDGRKFPIPV